MFGADLDGQYCRGLSTGESALRGTLDSVLIRTGSAQGTAGRLIAIRTLLRADRGQGRG